MVRLLACAAVICCVLLPFAAVVKSENIQMDIKQANQMSTNLHIINESIGNARKNLTIITRKLQTLEEVRPVNDDSKLYDNDICHKTSLFVSSTNRWHDSSKRQIEGILKDKQLEQLRVIDQILDPATDCKQGATPAITADALSIIEKFENDLRTFGVQHNRSQSQNEEQMKLLLEITRQLTQHQTYIEKLEQQLPNLMQPQKDANATNHDIVLPMDIVYAEPDNQTDSN